MTDTPVTFLIEYMDEDKLTFIEFTADGTLVNRGTNSSDLNDFIYPRVDQIFLRYLTGMISHPIMEFTTNDTDSHGVSAYTQLREIERDGVLTDYLAYLVSLIPVN